MSIYNIVASTDEATVVAEYAAEYYVRPEKYQSEAELEREFIRQLTSQGYEYISVHNEAALIENLRKQLELLNDFTFTDSEWDRFFTECIANTNEGIVEKTRKIQDDHIQILKREDGTTKNIYLLDKKNIHNNRLQVINQYEEAGGKHETRYDPEAKSERWNRFIHEIMSGDEEKAKFLQKAFGYSISGDTRYECLFVLYGATTRNGKGTLCESILKVLGSYGCTARPETISLKKNNNSSSPSEDIARLAGVRFVNISEPSRGLVLNAAQVKSMTGGDTINARFLHENSFDFSPKFKLYINTNYLPVITDMTLFSSGRVMIIPFERHFDESEQDKNLKREFAKPKNQSAILNWLIEGYQLLKKEGLTLPDSVKTATEAYKRDSDKIALFFEDALEESPNSEVRTSEVYARYQRWCSANGCYSENARNFKQALTAIARVERKRPRSGGGMTTMLIGYKLTEEEFLLI
jgi:P4 family phage/plasmid primase-like protien